MLDLLKELCVLPGVSGDEAAVRDYILNRVTGFTDEVTTDVMGNVIAFKRGKKTPEKKLMLCAHMDEVGVIITGFTDEGFIKFECVGGVDRRVIAGKPVRLGGEGVFGVISCKASHLVKSEEREKSVKVEDLYIDIGAKSCEDAKKQLSLGDTGAFDSETREIGGGLIKAKAIDDRFGCAVLLKLLGTELPVDCTFVFTVQEEVGTRGAQIASYRAAPDIALIIEGTTAADLPSVTGGKKVCIAGGGAVIPFMDGGAIYDRELYSVLTGLAEKNNIKWQTKTAVSGATDGSAVQRSRAGVRTAVIAAPVRYLHSPSCVGRTSDFDAVMKLVSLFLEEMGEEGK